MKTALIVFWLFALPGLGVSADIGLYFDPELTVTEVSLERYEAVLGYIGVVCDSIPDVAGWLGGLSWTDSLIVSHCSYAASCLDVRPFPDYEIGYAEPVESSTGRFILATVSIFPLGEGELCMSGVSTGEDPYCVSSHMLGVRIPLSGCQNKSVQAKVLNRVMLNVECGQASDVYFAPGAEIPLDSGAEQHLISGGDPRGDTMDLMNFGALLYRSEACFVGVVSDVDSRCYDVKGTNRGYAICVIELERSYWGYYGTRAIVAIPVSRLSGCSYHENTPWVSSVEQGDRFLVYANCRDGIFLPIKFGILLFPDDDSDPIRPNNAQFSFSDVRQKLVIMQTRRSYEVLTGDADLIITAEICGQLPLGVAQKSRYDVSSVLYNPRNYEKTDITLYFNGIYDSERVLKLVES